MLVQILSFLLPPLRSKVALKWNIEHLQHQRRCEIRQRRRLACQISPRLQDPASKESQSISNKMLNRMSERPIKTPRIINLVQSLLSETDLTVIKTWYLSERKSLHDAIMRNTTWKRDTDLTIENELLKIFLIDPVHPVHYDQASKHPPRITNLRKKTLDQSPSIKTCILTTACISYHIYSLRTKETA